jgi:hypothetical protein
VPEKGAHRKSKSKRIPPAPAPPDMLTFRTNISFDDSCKQMLEHHVLDVNALVHCTHTLPSTHA